MISFRFGLFICVYVYIIRNFRKAQHAVFVEDLHICFYISVTFPDFSTYLKINYIFWIFSPIAIIKKMFGLFCGMPVISFSNLALYCLRRFVFFCFFNVMSFFIHLHMKFPVVCFCFFFPRNIFSMFVSQLNIIILVRFFLFFIFKDDPKLFQ